jgi:hypothetical protein
MNLITRIIQVLQLKGALSQVMRLCRSDSASQGTLGIVSQVTTISIKCHVGGLVVKRGKEA